MLEFDFQSLERKAFALVMRSLGDLRNVKRLVLTMQNFTPFSSLAFNFARDIEQLLPQKPKVTSCINVENTTEEGFKWI